MKKKKWVLIAVSLILCSVACILILSPKEPTEKDILEGRIPNFDCVVLEYTPGRNTGRNTILVQPIESCEFGYHKDLTSFTKPIRIYEDEVRDNNAFDIVRYHLKNKTLDHYIFMVAYKDDDSFAETENEIILHNVYRFLQSHRISEYYQEQCNVCGKGCKAE